jgi:probable HAF family extracellular repeat protein
MNSAGEVIGLASSTNGIQEGFTYLNGHLSPVVPPGGVSSTVGAINDLGQIVGVYYPSSSSFLGGKLFLHTGLGSQDLGVALNLPSEEDTPSSINNVGDIVGNAETTVGEDAWIYKPGKGFSDLNNDILPNSGWSLFQAIGINERGEIVGNGIAGGQEHGFLLTPVPEPGSFILIGMTLIVWSENLNSLLRVLVTLLRSA